MPATLATGTRRAALLLVAAALLAACGTTPVAGMPVLTGDNATTAGAGSGGGGGTSRQVSGFTAVDLATSGDLTISRTGTESLTIDAEPSVLPLLTSDVVNGKLVLGVQPNTSVTTAKPIRYTLTVKDLDTVDVDGSGDVFATGLTGSTLNVGIAGSGNVTPSGGVDTQKVTIDGSGDYHGTGLASKNATVGIAGSADADVAVSGTLDVRITGAGSVTYSGDPTVTKIVTGSGDVTKK